MSRAVSQRSPGSAGMWQIKVEVFHAALVDLIGLDFALQHLLVGGFKQS